MVYMLQRLHLREKFLIKTIYSMQYVTVWHTKTLCNYLAVVMALQGEGYLKEMYSAGFLTIILWSQFHHLFTYLCHTIYSYIRWKKFTLGAQFWFLDNHDVPALCYQKNRFFCFLINFNDNAMVTLINILFLVDGYSFKASNHGDL